MTTPIKIAVATISVGGVAVGSGFGIHHLTKEKIIEPRAISEWLKDEGKALIPDTSEKTSLWGQRWTTFRDAHQSAEPTGIWTITGWSNKKTENNGLNDFKELCKTNVTKKINSKSEAIFKEVLDRCAE